MSKKQRIEILDYEERYKGIDITKLHEGIAQATSYANLAKMQKLDMENHLLEVRDFLFTTRDKFEGKNFWRT